MQREEVIETALALARTPDPNALSYRRIGRALGVDPSVLYRHFADKDELLAATLDSLWMQTVEAFEIHPDWRTRLRLGAGAFHDAIVRHPAIGVEAGHRTSGGPGEHSAIQLILAALEDAGLSRSAVPRFYAVYSGTVLALSAAQAAFELAQKSSGSAGSHAWISDHLVPDPERFALLHRHADALAAITYRYVFDQSILVIVEAIADAAESDRDLPS